MRVFETVYEEGDFLGLIPANSSVFLGNKTTLCTP